MNKPTKLEILRAEAGNALKVIRRLKPEFLKVVAGNRVEVTEGKATIVLDNTIAVKDEAGNDLPIEDKVFIVGGGGVLLGASNGSVSEVDLESLPTKTNTLGGGRGFVGFFLNYRMLVAGFTYKVTNKAQFDAPFKYVTVNALGKSSSEELSSEIADEMSVMATTDKVIKLPNYLVEISNTQGFEITVLAGEKATLILKATFIEK